MLRLLRAEYMRTVINERGRMSGFAEVVPTSAVKTAATTVVWRRIVRPVLFWTHVIAGVMTGGVVLVMSATGVLLTYQKQITTWPICAGSTAQRPPPRRHRSHPIR